MCTYTKIILLAVSVAILHVPIPSRVPLLIVFFFSKNPLHFGQFVFRIDQSQLCGCNIKSPPTPFPRPKKNLNINNSKAATPKKQPKKANPLRGGCVRFLSSSQRTVTQTRGRARSRPSPVRAVLEVSLTCPSALLSLSVRAGPLLSVSAMTRLRIDEREKYPVAKNTVREKHADIFFSPPTTPQPPHPQNLYTISLYKFKYLFFFFSLKTGEKCPIYTS